LAGAVSCEHPLEIRQSTKRHVAIVERLDMKRLNSTPPPGTRKEILLGRIQETGARIQELQNLRAIEFAWKDF
jgi:hypothetical protein